MEDTCVLNMVADYLLSFGASAMNTSCLAETIPPDFEGLTNNTQQMSMSYFGTLDLWNGM